MISIDVKDLINLLKFLKEKIPKRIMTEFAVNLIKVLSEEDRGTLIEEYEKLRNLW